MCNNKTIGYMIPVQGIHDMVLGRTHNFANLVSQNDTKMEDVNVVCN